MVVVKEMSVFAAEFAVFSEINNIDLLNVEQLEAFFVEEMFCSTAG